MATGETKAQMHPAGTHFLAFLTSFGIASDLLIYSINVHTSCLFLFRHGFNSASRKLKIIVSKNSQCESREIAVVTAKMLLGKQLLTEPGGCALSY